MSKINRKHIVKRTLFEVEVDKREDVENAQSNFSRLFNSRLKRIMDQVLSEFSDEKIQHRLEYLEIDIGTIDNRFFDRQVEERFETQLRNQLSQIVKLEHVRYPSKSVKLQKIKVEKSDLEVVLFFLETGRLDSWKSVKGPSIEDLLRNLINEKSPALAKALQKVAKKPGVVKRINHQFSKDTVNQVLKFIVPRSFSEITKQTRALERQFNKATPVAGLPPSKFSMILRESVLQYLLLERTGSFHKKSFLKSLDKQIEIRTGIEKEVLLQSTSKKKDKQEHSLEDFSKSEAALLEQVIQLLSNQSQTIEEQSLLTPAELIKILQASSFKLKSRLEQLKVDWKTVINQLKVYIPEKNKSVIEDFIEFIVEMEPKSKQEELFDTLLPILDKNKEEIEKIKTQKINQDTTEEQSDLKNPAREKVEMNDAEMKEEQDIDILFFLFKEAKIPWWIPNKSDSFKTILKRAIQQSQPAIKKIWDTTLKQVSYSKKKEVIRFMQQELDTTTLENFIEIIEPDFIGFILTQTIALEKLPEVKDPWIPVLSYLIEKGSKAFDLPQFIKTSITVVADQIARPAKEIGNEMLKLIQVSISQGQPRFVPLENILKTILPTLPSSSKKDPTKTKEAADLSTDQPVTDDPTLTTDTTDPTLRTERQTPIQEDQTPLDLLLSKTFKKPEELKIEEVLEAIEYYLNKGTLPPAISSFTVKQLEKLFEIGLLEKPLSARDILIKHLIKKRVRISASTVFSNTMLLKFIARAQPVNKPFYNFTEVLLTVSTKVKSTLITDSIKEFLLFYAVTAKESFDVVKTYRALLKHISREQSILLKEIATQLKAAFTKVSGKKDSQKVDQKKTKNTNPKNLTESIQQLTEALIVEYERKPQRKLKAKTPEELEKYRQENIKEDESIFIENSGIVLLYPLMRIAFNMLGYLTPVKTFKDVHSAYRAIHFLQYTATKQYKKVPEHKLALNKLLCGIPLSAPIETDIELTEKEIGLTDELIRQLIMTWPMVKNSSVDGLRGSFLIREGSLTKKKDVWILKVNEETYDVVLQSYPSALNMIKFQWMKDYTIRAEWGDKQY